MSGSTRAGLPPAERDALYRECALAIDAAGPERDRLFLARLALLLMETLGDAQRCREAIAAATLAVEGEPAGHPEDVPGGGERAEGGLRRSVRGGDV
jgi:hypothetical protein